MEDSTNRFSGRIVFKLFVLLFLLTLWSCSGDSSSGCTCVEAIPGGFPKADKLRNVSQAKLTRHGFDFLEKNYNHLLNQFLPNGLEFDIPKTNTSQFKLCLNKVVAGQPYPCKAKGKINSLKLNLKPSKTIEAAMSFDLSTTKIDFEVYIGFFWKACNLTAKIKNKAVSLDVDLAIDSQTQQLSFSIGSPNISIASSDFTIDGDILCDIADGLKGLFKGMIEKEIKKALQDALNDFKCMPCTSLGCPTGSTCQDNKCMKAGICLPRQMGMEGKTNLAASMQGFGNKTAKDLWFDVELGSSVSVQNSTSNPDSGGVQLGGLGGTKSEWHPCVTQKSFSLLSEPSTFTFPTIAPDGNKQYMLGFALSEVLLTQAMRDMYKGGNLCIKIDSSINDTLGALFSSKGLGAILSASLQNDLAPGKDLPMYIALRPTEPPQMLVGKGTFKTVGGKKTIDDPLMEALVPKLNFDFYAHLNQRWIRLFSYQADIRVPLGLDVLPGDKLGMVLGDLSNAFTNTEIKNNNILQENSASMAKSLDGLLKGLLPSLIGQIGSLEFPIPSFPGFQLVFRGIEGQVNHKTIAKKYQYLAMYIDLKVPSTSPLLPSEAVDVSVVQTYFPASFKESMTKGKVVTELPRVLVEVFDPSEDREYSFRINNGFWTAFSPHKQQWLPSAQFIREGKHKILVRTRMKKEPGSPISSSNETHVTVDYSGPKISLFHQKQEITAKIKDLSDGDSIRVLYRVNSGEWLKLPAGETIPTQKISPHSKVEVKAIDEHGNQSIQSIQLSEKPKKTLNVPEPAWGCQVVDNSNLPSGWFFFFLALFSLIWKKRSISFLRKN